jgi:hypothetical protein
MNKTKPFAPLNAEDVLVVGMLVEEGKAIKAVKAIRGKYPDMMLSDARELVNRVIAYFNLDVASIKGNKEAGV